MDYSIISNTPEESEADNFDFIIYNMKLTEELVAKLTGGQGDLDNLQGVEFVHTDKGTDYLKIGKETFAFMKVKESQPIHLLSNPSPSSNKLHLLGPVTHKLNPKLELEASKAEAIRQRSQEAEKERLARKTVELDVLPNKGQKKLIKRRPSITSTKPIINANTTNNANTNHIIMSSSIPLRTRIIQILALGPISIDQLIAKLYNNSHNSNSNNNVRINQETLKPFIRELCVNEDFTALRLNSERFEEVKVSVTEWPFYSMRERELVTRNINLHRRHPTTTTTPPETPETPSPKKQIVSINLPTRAVSLNSSLPTSAKKGTSVKDRLNAIMKRRK